MIAKDLLCTVCGRPYDNRSGWHSLLVPIAPAPVTTKAVCPSCMVHVYPGIAATIEGARRTVVCHDQHMEQIVGNSWGVY